MSTVLFWFRNDLRLHDNPALLSACAGGATHLVPVFCMPESDAVNPWGGVRVDQQRRAWLRSALADLRRQLALLNCPLLVCIGDAATILPALAHAAGGATIVCEEIAAPEEHAQLAALRDAGLTIKTVWQSSLLEPDQLPWPHAGLPASFTPFRHAVERAKIVPPAPLPPPASLPAWPPTMAIPPEVAELPMEHIVAAVPVDPRSSVPHSDGACDGGETAALAHLRQYFARKLPDTYKQTRNGLTGVDYSSKWSPWLATGALSARRIVAELREYECEHGASDGSYWLWFELLWRDYFRFLHLQFGPRLYRARALGQEPVGAHNVQGFVRWCEGRTGQPLIDAAMRELATTAYLSNRLRQVVASYLVYELGGDWRAGAAWFESQLLDYDVYSNQGNWLYLAGRGTDPRGGRRFNVDKQTADHDRNGSYRRLWEHR